MLTVTSAAQEIAGSGRDVSILGVVDGSEADDDDGTQGGAREGSGCRPRGAGVLECVESSKPKRGRKVPTEALTARLDSTNEAVNAETDPLKRLNLIQQA